MDPKDVDSLYIWRSGTLMGRLLRTDRGCRFIYDDGVLESSNRPRFGICVTMPYRREPYDIEGVNLHPYFANLLPEGLRFVALASQLKTSMDDLFTMFAAVGEDCVGDVYATTSDSPEPFGRAGIDLRCLLAQGFDEFMKGMINYTKEASIPGEQLKLSALKLTTSVWTRNFGTAFLKFAPGNYPHLVENESFFMECAKKCGIRIAKTAVLRDSRSNCALLVGRFDRFSVSNTTSRIHVEDGCQITNRYPSEKYRLSLKDVAASIIRSCNAPSVQLLRLLELTV